MLFTLKKVIGGLLFTVTAAAIGDGRRAGIAVAKPRAENLQAAAVRRLAVIAGAKLPTACLAPLETHYPTWQPRGETVNWIVVLGGDYTWNPHWPPSANLINNSVVAH